MIDIEIDGIKIGRNYPPYIIAEMSANHNGNIENAFEIVKKAKQFGANAVKMQTYTADTMTIKSKKRDFLIKDKNSLWNGYSLYDLYKKAHTPWSWHNRLFKEAKKLGLIYFSTPFDETSIEFLKKYPYLFLTYCSYQLFHFD